MPSTVLFRIVVPLWVLVGAMYKLLFAQPSELPSWIVHWLQRQDQWPWLPELMLHGFIGIELAAVGMMVFLPRLARPVAITILGAFVFVLIAEITHLVRVAPPDQGLFNVLWTGDCGCFGGKMTIPPLIMLIIDGGLLVLAVSLGGPRAKKAAWSAAPIAAAVVWVLVCGAVAWQSPLIQPEQIVESRDVEGWLYPQKWVGKHFDETELALHLNVHPTDYPAGTQQWIFYRKSCPVCHTMFEEEYAAGFPEGVDIVVAISVPRSRLVGSAVEPEEEVYCPQCEFTQLPEGTDWVVSTPSILTIDENSMIVDYEDRMLHR